MPAPMTRKMVEFLRRLLEAASDAPWWVDTDPREDPGPAHVLAGDDSTVAFMSSGRVAESEGEEDHDAELIVALRNDADALLSSCERLERAEELLERCAPEIYGTAMGGPREHAENKALLKEVQAFLSERGDT